MRAERHAQSDLVGAARDGVGHDAVDPDGGEDEGEEAEGSGEGGEDALLRERGVDLFGLRADVFEGQVVVDGLDGAAEIGDDCCGIAFSADLEGHAVFDLFVELAVGEIEGGRRIVAQGNSIWRRRRCRRS